MKELKSHEIRKLRRDLGWTQAEMGNYFNVNQTTVNGWEHGSEPVGPIREALVKMREELNKRKSKEGREKFIGLLTGAAAGGFIALMWELFKQSDESEEE